MSGLTGSPLLRPTELLASLTETFTSGLSTVRSPSPLPDITTVATGRFHRRVFHPLDLQLASLHRFRAFAVHSFLACHPLPTPGTSTSTVPEQRCRHGLRREINGSAFPKIPQSVSRGGTISGLPQFAHSLRPASLLAPLHGSDQFPSRRGLLRPGFRTDRSPFPPLDITTTVTGLLCWRDFHPQEWQLASLHDLSGSQTTHPVPLPRSKTPAEPRSLANNGRIRCCPCCRESKGSSV